MFSHSSAARSCLNVVEKNAVRIITLNRPTSLNALSLDMVRDLTTTIQAFEQSALCKLIILRGEGRAFCAGGDVKRMCCASLQLICKKT